MSGIVALPLQTPHLVLNTCPSPLQSLHGCLNTWVNKPVPTVTVVYPPPLHLTHVFLSPPVPLQVVQPCFRLYVMVLSDPLNDSNVPIVISITLSGEVLLLGWYPELKKSSKGFPPPKPSNGLLFWLSYCLLLFSSPNVLYASDIFLKFSSEPPLSGWCILDNSL